MPATDTEFLRSYLAERDIPCPVCGYNLRNLHSDRCPECGRGLMLQVGTTEPRMGAFITGLVGLAAGIGWNSFLLLWTLFVTIVRGRQFNRDMQTVLYIAIPCVAASGIGLSFWMRKRHWVRTRSERQQWLFAGLMWVPNVLSFLLFTWAIKQ
jgi:hypothetical protein